MSTPPPPATTAAMRELLTESRQRRSQPGHDPWPPLEAAHILSQPWATWHLRTHAAMLVLATRQRDPREIVGQLVRLAVAAPGSLTGRYPTGNTGRTTMKLTETAPIPPELTDLLP